jgi:hypothetical protein
MLSNKGRAKGRTEVDDDDAGSIDSMAMEIDEPGSDFGSDIGPPSARKAGTSRGKRAATSTMSGKKASGSGRKRMVSLASHSASEVRLTQVEAESDDEDDEEIDEVPKSTTRTRRAAAPRFVFQISRLLQTRLNYLVVIKKREKGPLLLISPRPRRNRQHWVSRPLVQLLGGRQRGRQPGEREGKWLSL